MHRTPVNEELSRYKQKKPPSGVCMLLYSALIWMKLKISGRTSQFFWSFDGKEYTEIGPCFDTTKFSDEYSEFGEFTGTFVGITCGDRMMHSHTADFDFFDYEADEKADVK